MRQRWLLNLALLLIILVLGALVFYTIEADKSPELPKLTNLKANNIQQIHIKRANYQPILLKKDKLKVWQMLAPIKLPANHIYVNRLLQVLSVNDYITLQAKKLNLADLGLEPPLARVTFDKITMDFGDISPMAQKKRYIQLNQKVHLIADTVYSLTNNALSFVSLSPLGFKPKITELKMPDYHLLLKEGQWKLVSSRFSTEEIDTSQDALNTLIDNWQHLNAFKVEPYVEGKAQGQIDITLKAQEQPLRFLIMSLTPDLLLARPDKTVQYKIDINQNDKLLHLPTKPKPTESTQLLTPKG